MAWRWPGDKPLSEPMMVKSLTHIYASLGLNELMISVLGDSVLISKIQLYANLNLIITDIKCVGLMA